MEFKLATWCWHDLHTIFGRVCFPPLVYKTHSEEHNSNLFNHLEWIKISLLNIYEQYFSMNCFFAHATNTPFHCPLPISAYVLFLLWQVEHFIFHNQEKFQLSHPFYMEMGNTTSIYFKPFEDASDFNAKSTKYRQNNQTRMISIRMAENNNKSINFFSSEK